MGDVMKLAPFSLLYAKADLEYLRLEGGYYVPWTKADDRAFEALCNGTLFLELDLPDVPQHPIESPPIPQIKNTLPQTKQQGGRPNPQTLHPRRVRRGDYHQTLQTQLLKLIWERLGEFVQLEWAKFDKKQTEIPWAWLEKLEDQIGDKIPTLQAFEELQRSCSSPRSTAATGTWPETRSGVISASLLTAVIDKIISINSGYDDPRVLYPGLVHSPNLIDQLSAYVSVVPHGKLQSATAIVKELHRLTISSGPFLQAGVPIAPGVFNRWLASQVPLQVKDIQLQQKRQKKREQEERRTREKEEEQRRQAEEERREREEEEQRKRKEEEQRKREEEEQKREEERKQRQESKRQCLEAFTKGFFGEFQKFINTNKYAKDQAFLMELLGPAKDARDTATDSCIKEQRAWIVQLLEASLQCF